MPSLADILGRGYFPVEFPPPFHTAEFAQAVCGPSGELRRDFVASFPTAKRCAALGIHNLVRSGGLRRNLGIPHPMSYARQAEFMSVNWTQLHRLASASPFSLSKPVDTKPARAISLEHDFDEKTERLIELRANARFILVLDVNRFYPSIYSHSLPWAILGKSEAKRRHAARTLSNHWSDKLDTLTRNLNDAQTMGIPIGPDTSRIVAEIVLGAVDVELATKWPDLKGIRFVDDYEFAVAERSDAEAVASDLQAILGQYELALNSSKTGIFELPQPFEPLPISRLRTFRFRDTDARGQRYDLTAYFDTAFDFVKQDAEENTLKFAIRRLNGVTIKEENWGIFQRILSQCVVNEPACLFQTCEQLTHYRNLGRTIDSNLWEASLNRVIVERLSLGQASEAVWAMYLLLQLNLPLAQSAEAVVGKSEDSLAGLMGLALREAGLAHGSGLDPLNVFAEPDELFGRQWLLCYEASRRGWLRAPSGANALTVSGPLNYLADRNVSFFYPNTPPVQPRRKPQEELDEDAAGDAIGGSDYPD